MLVLVCLRFPEFNHVKHGSTRGIGCSRSSRTAGHVCVEHSLCYSPSDAPQLWFLPDLIMRAIRQPELSLEFLAIVGKWAVDAIYLPGGRELLNANSSTTMWQMPHDHIRPIASRFFSHHQAKPKNAQQHGKQNQLLPQQRKQLVASLVTCSFQQQMCFLFMFSKRSVRLQIITKKMKNTMRHMPSKCRNKESVSCGKPGKKKAWPQCGS
jgi:hypothetical protein